MKEKTLVILDPVLKQGFTPVPIAVLTARGLSIEAKGLYMVLSMFARGGVSPNRQELAEVTGFSERKIDRLLRELKQKGYLPVLTPFGRVEECRKRH